MTSKTYDAPDVIVEILSSAYEATKSLGSSPVFTELAATQEAERDSLKLKAELLTTTQKSKICTL